ncbi:hypothetical protein G6F42_009879 [Rhizopus arrhizus]|nr:hypothetical protein G6F42_009879 [Rhizopus arrhizus]
MRLQTRSARRYAPSTSSKKRTRVWPLPGKVVKRELYPRKSRKVERTEKKRNLLFVEKSLAVKEELIASNTEGYMRLLLSYELQSYEESDDDDGGGNWKRYQTAYSR